jgi:hypothetical protein
MSDNRLTFGKYKGIAAELAPVEYYAWALKNMTKPPQIVFDELKRRAERRETPEGLIAQEALSSHQFKRRPKARRGQQDFWEAKLREKTNPRRRRRKSC